MADCAGAWDPEYCQRRFDKLEEKIDTLGGDLSKLFRNGPISRLQQRVSVHDTLLKLVTGVLSALCMVLVGKLFNVW